MKLIERINDAIHQAKNSFSNHKAFPIFESKYGRFSILRYKKNFGLVTYSLLLSKDDEKTLLDNTMSPNGKMVETRMLNFIHETSQDRKTIMKYGFEALNYLQYEFNDYILSIERSWYHDLNELILGEYKNWVNDENAILVQVHLKGNRKNIFARWTKNLETTMKEFGFLHYMEMKQEARDWMVTA